MSPQQVVEDADADLLCVPLDGDCDPICRCNTPGQQHHQQLRTSWLQRRVSGAILFYQRAREGRPSPCRFFPSCSAYALEAVETHGTWRGGWLAARRLLRCRPLGPSGFDPVPVSPETTPGTTPDTTTPDAACSCPPSPVTPSPQKGG